MVRPSEHAQLVEHWWNRRWARARLDVYLYREGDRWTVVATERQERDLTYRDMTEPQARAYLGYLLRTAPPGGKWCDITGAHQQPA